MSVEPACAARGPGEDALGSLKIDSSFVRALPGDVREDPRSRTIPRACFARARPTPVAAPRMLAWSEAVARSLGLPSLGAPLPNGLHPLLGVLAGNEVPPGWAPYAAAYGGHQFGRWAQQLGDGRAITLTEVLGANGERWDLQLKGAGPTPYARKGDGRAVLRSSLREFVASEAMAALGVPTTRALSLVATGERVYRDRFYDGRAAFEPGAVVARVAPSFLRFGSFELPAARREGSVVRALATYALSTHFPELGPPTTDAYVRFFDEVCRRSGALAAAWMSLGFVHGVLNTDNLSILGLTVDYGPFGWLDAYDPRFTPNTSDAPERRYRFEAQPRAVRWSLARLAHALRSLTNDPQAFESGLQTYDRAFAEAFASRTAARLGLRSLSDPGDVALVDELFACLQATPTDLALFFRALCALPLDTGTAEETLLARVHEALYTPDDLPTGHAARLCAWLRRYVERARADAGPSDPGGVARRARMERANPLYLPRNHLLYEAAIEAERGSYARLHRLIEVLGRPYEAQPGAEDLSRRAPSWSRDTEGCHTLSCSS